MYIAPDSTITLLSGVPLNNTYQNTLWFQTEPSQHAYFEGLTFRTFVKNSYQRVGTNQIKLQISPYTVYNCNYLMFQNRAWSTKWFYAFIINVEYVNNECSLITYELDVIQTWFFETKLKECFVEREHAYIDEPGSSLTDEPVDIGPVVCTGYEKYGLSGYYVLITVADADGEAGEEGTGLYSPLRYVKYSQFQQNELNQYFNQVVVNNLQDSVVGVTVMPSAFIDAAGNINPYGSKSIAKPTTVGGYSPRNKKLLTAPYVYLSVDALNDASAYRYEFFNGDNATFDIYCYVSPEVEVSCTPTGYNGGAGPTEELILRGFPQLPFIIDSYRAWLAQNSTSDLLSIGGSVVGAIGSAATGNVAGVVNSVMGAASTVNRAVIESTKGDRARGVQSGGLDSARGVKDFYFKYMSITGEFARIIDDFFDKYGYACNRNKRPGITNRQRWNYVKTRGCSPFGNVPGDALRKIAGIYDAGITFWMDGDVGNYNRANPIRGAT